MDGTDSNPTTPASPGEGNTLDPEISDEAWAEEVARREAKLKPTDVEFGPCKVPTPHAKPSDKPPVAPAPRPGVATNPAEINARRAIVMGQRSAGGTRLDAAMLLLRAAADPESSVHIGLGNGTVLEGAKPNVVKGAFIGADGLEHSFEDCCISFENWAKWLAANGRVGFRPGTAAWREGAVAAPAPMSVAPAGPAERNKGGRPPREDMESFNKEVTRRLALDGGNTTLTQFRKEMKNWADDKMKPAPPDDRTIDRWLDKLVDRSVFPE
jgi:hypothetical protein